MRIDARTRGAALPRIEEDAVRRPLRCKVKIRVGENDDRRLATQFKADLLNAVCGIFHNELADFGRTGEGDLVHAGMIDNRRANCAVAGQNVHDPIGEACFLNQLAKTERA